MKVKTDIKCECGFKTSVEFKKPAAFCPTFGTFHCGSCESRIQYHIMKAGKGQCRVFQKVIEMSDDLRLIKMEESSKQVSVV